MKVTVRNLAASLFARLLILSGFVRRAKKKAKNGEYILSVYFHNPSRKEFEACVKWLKKNRFIFLSVSELDEVIQGYRPFPRGGVLLTFDDGWQSNEANIIEVAEKYCIPVTIFVATAPVENGSFWWSLFDHDVSLRKALKKVPNNERLLKVMEVTNETLTRRDALTVEQVEAAAHTNYVTIGAHSHTHPILVNCDDEEVFSELRLSKEKLEAWTGKEVAYFAYPNGDYSKREIRILHDLDYHLAFCSEPRYLTPDSLKERYTLPRFGLLEGASLAENICRLTGVWKKVLRQLRSSTLK